MPQVIDTQMHGRPGITAAYLIEGPKVALVETGPMSSVDRVAMQLDALGIDHLDYIIVTHIHLDHAGAAGTLALRYPNATVCVHPVGAPHLIDPTKLWASSTRIYGAAMESLWGGIDPIAPDRIRLIADGDEIDLGDRKLRAVETPGHASHHHAYLDESVGDLYTGDGLGVFLQDPAAMRPTTPPPELDVEVFIESIQRLAALGANKLWFTHFGPHAATAEVFTEAQELLRRWEDWVRSARVKSMDLAEVTIMVQEMAAASREGDLTNEQIDRLQQTTSYRMNVMGYMRYIDKLGAP